MIVSVLQTKQDKDKTGELTLRESNFELLSQMSTISLFVFVILTCLSLEI